MDVLAAHAVDCEQDLCSRMCERVADLVVSIPGTYRRHDDADAGGRHHDLEPFALIGRKERGDVASGHAMGKKGRCDLVSLPVEIGKAQLTGLVDHGCRLRHRRCQRTHQTPDRALAGGPGDVAVS